MISWDKRATQSYPRTNEISQIRLILNANWKLEPDETELLQSQWISMHLKQLK
jgi:hypothetical protein